MTDPVNQLGEVLRAAREAKGADLARVERDTKIRERYLSALERGDYRDLPGSVYIKGFLRNYGAYLGLDPEYLIDLYRLETASARPEAARLATPRRPISTRRSRTFVVTPGAVVAAILTLLVGAFIAYLGYELINFAREPELTVTDPPGPVADHPEETITLRGATSPNATVTVMGLRQNPTARADAEGNFELTVNLVPGSNVIRLVATDPVTGRDSSAVERTVNVVNELAPSPSARPVALEITEPATGASVASPIVVRGSAEPGSELTVVATLSEPIPAGFTIIDAAGTRVPVSATPPVPPEPLAVTAGPDGVFAAELALAPGAWEIGVSGPGQSDPASVAVTVPRPDGLSGVLRVEGGQSYLELDADGTPVDEASGTIVDDGESVRLRASRELRIRVGNAGAVRLAINGVSIASMGGAGAVVEWRIARDAG